MKKFHFMQAIPPHRHQLRGGDEFIETMKWGLEQLGYEASRAINSYELACRNIIVGAQVLPQDFIQNFPDDTIIFNTEQMKGLTGDDIRSEIHFLAKHFEIWDYKQENLSVWATFKDTRSIKCVPIGYAPVLTRIEKPAYQDIDVLIYGVPSENRIKALDKLANVGLSVVFACGFYGESRDSLIARAKVIVNVSAYPAQQFEIVRVSYLLANKKAVLSVLEENTTVEEEDIKSCVKFTTFENLVVDCCQLVDNEAERIHLEQLGFETIAKRDIRDILKTALG